MSSAPGLALLSLLPTTTTTSSGWCGSSYRSSRRNNIESRSRSRRSSFCRNIPLKLERASAGFCGLNNHHHRAAASGRGGALGGGSGGSRGGTSFCWSGRKTMFPNRRRDGDENKSNWTSWELFGNGEKHNTARRLNDAKAMSSTDEEISNYLPGFKDCPRNLKVAYQGEPGAYSEAAALTAYPDAEPFPCGVFEEAYEATESQKSDRSVLPFENSLGGSIHKNYDLILTHDLHVVGEVNFKVNHCLMALPGTKKENLTRAMSHPQALAQCDDYLTQLGVIKESAEDTAGSAKKIQEEKLENVAAVASERAATLYGMEILDSKIQDDSEQRVPYKTSIVFANKDGPGSLFKALACFALRDINLTKIESRPLKTARRWRKFQYLFYVDFEASMAEERAKNALRNLQEQTSFLRVLGSYPKDVSKF
ncbi:unnamed protein product [Bathycoccus prasinos]